MLKGVVFFVFLAGATECTHFKSSSGSWSFFEFREQSTALTGEFPPDSALLAYLLPYKDTLDVQMNQVVAISNSELTRARPESTLGNLVAEAMREQASVFRREHIDIGFTNLTGLRVDVPAGEVTVGTIFEVMPFENRVTLLRLKGIHIRALLNDIAQKGGEPISGVRFRVKEGKATDIVIGNAPLQDEERYWMATNDYLANGGMKYEGLLKFEERIDLPLLLRTAIIQYMENRMTIMGALDGRIR